MTCMINISEQNNWLKKLHSTCKIKTSNKNNRMKPFNKIMAWGVYITLSFTLTSWKETVYSHWHFYYITYVATLPLSVDGVTGGCKWLGYFHLFIYHITLPQYPVTLIADYIILPDANYYANITHKPKGWWTKEWRNWWTRAWWMEHLFKKCFRNTTVRVFIIFIASQDSVTSITQYIHSLFFIFTHFFLYFAIFLKRGFLKIFTKYLISHQDHERGNQRLLDLLLDCSKTVV